MSHKPLDPDFQEISALLKKEEDEALAFFRKRNFRARLEVGLQETAAVKWPAAFFRRFAGPVLTTVLVLVLAGTVILVRKHRAPGPAPGFETLASALSPLPGFTPSLAKESAAMTGPAGTFELADLIGQALASAEKIKMEEEKRISVPTGTGKVPRLSPGRRMEILFKEKVIERALRLATDDSKEV